MPNQEVDEGVGDNHEEGQEHLDLGRERARIHDGEHVMVDKASRVTRGARVLTQPVFEWRQRADPATELDQGTPQSGWKLEPWNPAPAEREQTTKDDEDDEREMSENDEICMGSKEHLWPR